MDTTETIEKTIKVGDILFSSWGYSMVIVNWYQVISTTPKMVTVRELESRIVSGDGMRGESLPLPNKFVPKKYWQDEPETFKRRVINGGIKINDSERARIWNGEPKYHDHWD